MQKRKTIPAIQANRGTASRYKKTIQRLIDDMARSVEYWLVVAYRKTPPATLAKDASPVEDALKAIKTLRDKWSKVFADDGSAIAQFYVARMFRLTDSAFKQALKDAGMSVEFRMTPVMRDAYKATLSENVGLIRSIPEQYFQQIEGIVTRSYAVGRDLGTMTQELKALYPKAAHRAELIARDQSNKANGIVIRARQLELGITDAIWMHSSAGKQPRPDHVAANGKVYKVAEGCLISGEYILPGQLINCRCSCRSVLPW